MADPIFRGGDKVNGDACTSGTFDHRRPTPKSPSTTPNTSPNLRPPMGTPPTAPSPWTDGSGTHDTITPARSTEVDR